MFSKILKELMEQLTNLGGLFFYGIIIVFFLFNNLNVFYDLLIALIIIMLVSIAIRYFYFKERPKKRKHKNFFEKIDAASFPSMHSARIVSLFVILSGGQNIWTILLFFFTTIIVLYSRIYFKLHSKADVLGGIILGFLSSIFLL